MAITMSRSPRRHRLLPKGPPGCHGDPL